jgi:hypothetical protein
LWIIRAARRAMHFPSAILLNGKGLYGGPLSPPERWDP